MHSISGWTSRLMIACGLLSVMACTHRTPTQQAAPDAPAYIVVQNTLPEPFRLYVNDGAQRLPVGSINPLSTSRFRIPPSVVFPATTLEFQAVPASNAAPAFSERLIVNPGDEIHLRLAR